MGVHAEHRFVVSAEPPAEVRRGTRSIAIIGAGPAGLFAAEALAANGHAVTIYDRMPSPARKFLMAGRGGLNLTHSEELPTFLTRYHDPGGVIARAVSAFPPGSLIAWANALGAETFIGSSGRVSQGDEGVAIAARVAAAAWRSGREPEYGLDLAGFWRQSHRSGIRDAERSSVRDCRRRAAGTRWRKLAASWVRTVRGFLS